MTTKDYCALYANAEDKNYIDDCTSFDSMPELKRIIGTLSSNDSPSTLHKLFDICFNEALTRSFPAFINITAACTPHKQYPNLFFQCVFSSLATIENFIFSDSSLHINALLSMPYTKTDKYMSNFDVKVTSNEKHLTMKRSANFNRNYKYASEFYNSVLNP